MVLKEAACRQNKIRDVRHRTQNGNRVTKTVSPEHHPSAGDNKKGQATAKHFWKRNVQSPPLMIDNKANAVYLASKFLIFRSSP